MSKDKLFFVVGILSLMGISLAVYLLWQQYTLPAFSPCSINATINCDAIISGEVAKTFGIPTPLYGLIGYIVIFFAALFKQKKLILAMSTFGLLFCLWIAYVELFQLYVICPICIACQTIMISVFSIAVILNRKKSVKIENMDTDYSE